MDQDRRAFIKKSCTLCAALIGITAVAPLVQGCAPLLTVKTSTPAGGIIEVDRTKFTVENKMVIIKNATMEFDIALVQLADDNFKAFELQCTHQANPLVPTKNGFFCNAHGSSFSLEGQVTREPALKNLKEYPVEITRNNIKITV